MTEAKCPTQNSTEKKFGIASRGRPGKLLQKRNPHAAPASFHSRALVAFCRLQFQPQDEILQDSSTL